MGAFEGQVALVTGAAQGLGRAIATLLARRVAAVYFVDLNGTGAETAAAALHDEGLTASGHACDMADEPAVLPLRDRIASERGRLDVLINNAGGWRYETIREVTMANWDWTFRVNLLSMFVASRACMDMMIERRYGRIVNVSSTDGYRPKPTLPVYAAAKAAVVSLTRTFAEELAPHQVIVNAVAPGAIATETAKSQSWLAQRIPTIPVRRAAEPEDIAETVLFLASQANRYVVGECVIANGGALMA
ncbi:MAG TPA: SDR family oxidoreductase [Ktedonobacterales bacterium]|nr:SDR family oxidoreductase [Ktedonobacterales bacterium]